MFAPLLLTACEGPPPVSIAMPEVTAGPELAALDPVVPLTRIVLLETDLPCTVTASWTDASRTRTATGPFTRHHRIGLVGMGADTDYRVELTLTASNGSAAPAGELTFRSEPLPAMFPDVRIREAQAPRMEPGDTLVTLVSGDAAQYVVVLDPAGNVVWLRDDTLANRMWDLAPVGEDRLLGHFEYGDVLETDWIGTESARWSSLTRPGTGIPVAVGEFHHDVRGIGDDDLLALTRQVQVVPDFPISYDDPSVVADADVVIDHVVRFQRDGTVVYDYDLGEVLDPRRLGWYSLWNVYPPGYDWGHANSVAEHLADGGLVVSLRHQDAVIEIDAATGELRWILANPDNWSPELEALRLQPVGTPFEWPWHPHAAEPGDDGRVLLFDNGNARGSTPGTGVPEPRISELWSRVVEYRVDEASRTVEQLWAFEPPGERLWSGALGNAERQPLTANVLSVWGYVTQTDGVGNEVLGLGAKLVRLIEFAPETGEVFWDAELSSPVDEVPLGWNAYRGHRIPEL